MPYKDRTNPNLVLRKRWGNMLDRCYNPNHKSYKGYGGRGIGVCDEWRNSYLAFKQWAISTGFRIDLTLERNNNFGGYCPDNCKWATRKEQANNTRRNTRYYFNGERLTVAQAALKFQLDEHLLRRRISRGRFVIEQALPARVIAPPVRVARPAAMQCGRLE